MGRYLCAATALALALLLTAELGSYADETSPTNPPFSPSTDSSSDTSTTVFQNTTEFSSPITQPSITNSWSSEVTTTTSTETRNTLSSASTPNTSDNSTATTREVSNITEDTTLTHSPTTSATSKASHDTVTTSHGPTTSTDMSTTPSQSSMTEDTTLTTAPSNHSTTPNDTVTTSQWSTAPTDTLTTPSVSGTSTNSSLSETTMRVSTETEDTSPTTSLSSLTTTLNSSEGMLTTTRPSESANSSEETSPTFSSSTTVTPTTTNTSSTFSSSTTVQSATTNNTSSTSPQPGQNTTETTKETPETPLPLLSISLSFHITNRTFTEELNNSTSEKFQNMRRTIIEVYDAIYNCSSCPGYDEFVRYGKISFSNGSIAVNSVLVYRATNRTLSDKFLTDLEYSLKNASEEKRQGLNMTEVKAVRLSTVPTAGPSTTKPTTTEATPRTDDTSLTVSASNLTTMPKPSEDTLTSMQSSVSPEDHTSTESHSSPKDTSPTSPSNPSRPKETTKAPTTTPAPVVLLSLTYHIKNWDFTEELKDRNSKPFKNLSDTIGNMYQAVYNSSSSADRKDYLGYYINSFSPGSVKVDSEVRFRKNDRTSSADFVNQVETSLREAPKDSRQGMELTDIKATEISSTTKTDSGGVPGWGIALLVLVSILLFLALLALAYLIVYWCRRRHRGHLDLISTRDSYHPMNEYPTYETHGRYAAPGSKQNPYNKTLPRNGTTGFSYTNPAMTNDNQ